MRILLYLKSGHPSKDDLDIIAFLNSKTKKGDLGIRNGQFFVNPERGWDKVVTLINNQDILNGYGSAITSLEQLGYGVEEKKEDLPVQSVPQEEVLQKAAPSLRGRKPKQS